MYATDRQTSDGHHCLMPPTPGAMGITTTSFITTLLPSNFTTAFGSKGHQKLEDANGASVRFANYTETIL